MNITKDLEVIIKVSDLNKKHCDINCDHKSTNNRYCHLFTTDCEVIRCDQCIKIFGIKEIK